MNAPLPVRRPNNAVHRNDSRDHLKIGIERQNHGADPLSALRDQCVNGRHDLALTVELPQELFY
jgi:hypothetical protein